MRMITYLFAGFGLIYLAAGVALYFNQSRLVYFPNREHVTPAHEGLAGVEELTLKTPDGEKVICWYAKAQPGQPTILYFHGNAGNISTRSERIRKYIGRGRGMFMLDYRGFGGSTGKPSEAANVADAKQAYEALRREGVAAKDIILYGESIGSGVAVQVAAESEAAGLILDAPYTALVDVAANRYRWFPISLMMTDRYESRRYLPGLKLPLLVVHGERDQAIPVAMGREVVALHGGPKQLVTFPEAGHADHYLFGSFEAINAWIDRLRAGALAKPK